MFLYNLLSPFKYICLVFILIIPSKTYAASDKFNISGFARAVGGYLDENSAEYQGYDNTLTFSPDSLLGIKGEYRYNDQLSFVAQGIFTKSDIHKSGFDWLYVTYKPSANWQFDFGRYRTPFFEYSEVTHVGFAYPWVLPPQTTYVNVLFASVDGARATYLFNLDKLDFSISAFSGNFDNNIFDRESSVKAETALLSGINFRINVGNFRSRVGYINTDYNVKLKELSNLQNSLKSFNFNETSEQLNLKGEVDIYQFSAAYETVNYFALTEAILIKSETKLIPLIESYYLTLGIFHNNLTYYISASKLRTTSLPILNEIPKGITPQLDLLQHAVDQIINDRLNEDVDIATIGMRWDIKANLAFKAEIDVIDGKTDQRSTFNRINKEKFDHLATLYLFSIDWLF